MTIATKGLLYHILDGHSAPKPLMKRLSTNQEPKKQLTKLDPLVKNHLDEFGFFFECAIALTKNSGTNEESFAVMRLSYVSLIS